MTHLMMKHLVLWSVQVMIKQKRKEGEEVILLFPHCIVETIVSPFECFTSLTLWSSELELNFFLRII